MEESIKVFSLVEERDDYDLYVCGQEVYDGDKLVYHVWNLTDCPEDAIIERSLFSAHQWRKAVKYGMELAHQGYTGVGFKMEGENG